MKRIVIVCVVFLFLAVLLSGCLGSKKARINTEDAIESVAELESTEKPMPPKKDVLEKSKPKAGEILKECKEQGGSKDECYDSTAFITGDEEICELMNQSQDTCYARILSLVQYDLLQERIEKKDKSGCLDRDIIQGQFFGEDANLFCLDRIAILLNDASGCQKTPYEDLCKTVIAGNTGDITLCEGTSGFFNYLCHMAVSKKTGNTDNCISKGPSSSSEANDIRMCKLEVAIDKKDSSFCEGASLNENDKQFCLALTKRDASSCKFISEEPYCTMIIANMQDNHELCSRLDKTSKKQCLLSLMIKKHDPALCRLMEGDEREECAFNFVFFQNQYPLDLALIPAAMLPPVK